MTPYWGDDYFRMVGAGPMKSFILAWHDYFSWTGRIFVGAATYALMSASHRWSAIPFDILNAAVFTALAYIVTRLARSNPAASAGSPAFTDLIFVALMLWWLPKSIAEAALWKTGAIGYLWPVTAELFLLAYNCWPPSRPGFAADAGLGVAALVTATALEPLSLLFSGIFVARATADRRREQKFSRRLAIMASCHLFGTIILFAAPGNYARAHSVAAVGLVKHFLGWLGFCGGLFDITWLPAVLIVALPYLLSWRRERVPARLPASSWRFALFALLYALILLALPPPLLAPRLAFPATVLLVIFIASIFGLRPHELRSDQVTTVLVCLLIVPHLVRSVKDLSEVKGIDQRWKGALAQEHAGPQTDAAVPIIKLHGHMMLSRKDQFFESIEPDPSHWINQSYARAMDLKSVTGDP